MKTISRNRHAGALRKELRFWGRHDASEISRLGRDRYRRFFREEAESFGLTGADRALDAGCGPTCLAQHLGSDETWYLDPLLDGYRKLFGEAIPDGVHISAGIEDADLEAGCFDVAISANALDHFRDPWLALAAIARCLKSGGGLLLSMYVRGAVLASLRNLQERLWISTDRAHPYSFTRNRLERDLAAAGFSILTARILKRELDRMEMLWVCRKRPPASGDLPL